VVADSDCVVASGAVGQLMRAFRAHPEIGALAGDARALNGDQNFLTRMQDSWYDGKPCIVLDYSKTSIVAHLVRDEIREIAPGVYLGLVFLGRLHVLDFALDFNRRQ